MHTKSKLIVVAAVGAVTMVAAPALAQEQEEGTPYFQRSLAAPKRAFELSVLPGYSQPFGDIERGFSIRDTAGGGGSVQIGAAYRVVPRWSLGLVGAYGQYGNGVGRATFVNAGDASTAAVGVEGVFHLLPYNRVDPFLTLGTGWRGMWERHDGPSNDTFRHGLSLARVGIGVDIRISRDVAIAPVVAGDANMFLWQNVEGTSGSTTIVNPRTNLFLTAGLQGRFDLAGERVDRYGAATSTTTTTGAEVERMPEPMAMPPARPAEVPPAPPPSAPPPATPPPRVYPVDPLPMQR
jgi:hypothetical protein